MSGPTAATFGLDAGLLVAFEAARAAQAIAEGYAAEQERQAELRDEREAEHAERRQATLAAQRALLAEIAGTEARWQRLADARQMMAAHLGASVPAVASPPARPAEDDSAALVAYLAALRSESEALANAVTELSARGAGLPAADLAAIVAAAPNLAEQLAAFEAQVRLARLVAPAVAAARRAEAERILARLLLTERATLPEDLATLAAELMRTPSDERAAALATELRLRVARHNELATAQAAARVLAESLADLGYEVAGIGATLFVDGGVAHFQKAGWRDYFVRLRIDAERGNINFNVVRAGTASAERRHEDMLAEERWCAEFPRLRETLAVRGIRLAVTRMLDAGQVPVQVVAAESLPRRVDDDRERQQRGGAPRAMPKS
jgi:hypothetical protein